MPSATQKTVGLAVNRDQLKEGSVSYKQLNLDIKPFQVMILLQEATRFIADVNLAAQVMSVPVVNDIARKNKDLTPPNATGNYHSPYFPVLLHSVKVHTNPTTRILNNALLNSTIINGNRRDYQDLSGTKARMFFDYELYQKSGSKDDVKEFASAVSYKVIKGDRDTVLEYRYSTFLQHLLSVEKKGIGTTTGGKLTQMSYIDFDYNKCMARFIDNARSCSTSIQCGRFEVSFGANQQNEIRFFLETLTKLIPSILQFITDRISKDDVLEHARLSGGALTSREYELAIENLDSSSPYYSAIIDDLNRITNIDPRTGTAVRVKDVNYVDIRRFLQTYLPGLYSVLYTSRGILATI